MSTGKRLNSFDRMLEILDVLTAKGEPMSAYGIAKQIKAPISSVYTVANALLKRGMLSRGDNNMLWLGPRTVRYGLAFEKGTDLMVAARQQMERLAAKLGETVQVCVRDEGMMVVYAMARGVAHFQVTSDVGTRIPLNWTASGRLLVGHLEHEERLAIFKETVVPSPTSQALTDPKELARKAREDFDASLATQYSQSEFAVACIASPICDRSGACVATMSVVLPEQKAVKHIKKFSKAVKEAANLTEHAAGIHFHDVAGQKLSQASSR